MQKHWIIARTDHRPWPMPKRPWLMEQVWHDLLFLHWPIKADSLAGLIPGGLEIDKFEGQAWLGIVPFRMSGIRRRWWPEIPGHHTFGEINVRTYVKWRGQPGVWFLSLDAANRLAVLLARRFFNLPYFLAQIDVQTLGSSVGYECDRQARGYPPARFSARYRPTGLAATSLPGTLEHWLTERYRLFAADARGRLWAGDIHHLPWPLELAECDIKENSMAASHGIHLPEIQPLIHFSRRLEVLIWSIERLAV